MTDPTGWSSRLDNPVLVQWEYASEERLRRRNAIYHELVEGDDAEDMVFAAVAEAEPDVLDVGCGTGELAARIMKGLRADVVAVDVSPRMVDLARERGVEARTADAAALPFPDDGFDCVVAAWVIYHIPERDRAIRELARVLRPGGRLVAATIGEDNFAEVWMLLGEDWHRESTFDRDNGAAQLEPSFALVERRDANGKVAFRTGETLRAFVSASMTRAHLSGRVPELSESLVARTRHTIFVADKAS